MPRCARIWALRSLAVEPNVDDRRRIDWLPRVIEGSGPAFGERVATRFTGKTVSRIACRSDLRHVAISGNLDTQGNDRVVDARVIGFRWKWAIPRQATGELRRSRMIDGWWCRSDGCAAASGTEVTHRVRRAAIRLGDTAHITQALAFDELVTKIDHLICSGQHLTGLGGRRRRGRGGGLRAVRNRSVDGCSRRGVPRRRDLRRELHLDELGHRRRLRYLTGEVRADEQRNPDQPDVHDRRARACHDSRAIAPRWRDVQG